MGGADEPRLGDIWARTGEVTHRMKFGFGEAGEGNFLPQICPRPRSSSSPRRQFFRARWMVILMTATLSRRACTIRRAMLGCQRT